MKPFKPDDKQNHAVNQVPDHEGDQAEENVETLMEYIDRRTATATSRFPQQTRPWRASTLWRTRRCVCGRADPVDEPYAPGALYSPWQTFRTGARIARAKRIQSPRRDGSERSGPHEGWRPEQDRSADGEPPSRCDSTFRRSRSSSARWNRRFFWPMTRSFPSTRPTRCWSS